MKRIVVQAPGLLTTVQDLGRGGFGTIGVSPSGAADSVAMRVGNRLVGNAENAAGLEMTLVGGTFLFPEGAIIALTGSDFGAAMDGDGVEQWHSVKVARGQTLRTESTRSGARCYLCVQGGVAVKNFLGSASTHLLSGLGGHEGRALRRGDVLAIGGSGGRTGMGGFHKRTVSADALESLSPRKTLRVTPGPQSDWFDHVSRNAFYAGGYRVAEESNRMGMRLQGAPILAATPKEMITEGVSLGAVQIAAGGLPIILLVEQQTTGGYPKIANVITADLSSLGQLRPRDEIRFEQVDWDTARELLMQQEEVLASEELIRE